MVHANLQPPSDKMESVYVQTAEVEGELPLLLLFILSYPMYRCGREERRRLDVGIVGTIMVNGKGFCFCQEMVSVSFVSLLFSSWR